MTHICRLQALAGRIAAAGVGMHRADAEAGAVTGGIVHLAPIEPIAFGVRALDLVGHADRNRIAVKVKLADRVVKGDRVAEKIQDVVCSPPQRGGADDVAAVLVADQDLDSLGAVNVPVEGQVIGT